MSIKKIEKPEALFCGPCGERFPKPPSLPHVCPWCSAKTEHETVRRFYALEVVNADGEKRICFPKEGAETLESLWRTGEISSNLFVETQDLLNKMAEGAS